jgi:hypothetical protein
MAFTFRLSSGGNVSPAELIMNVRFFGVDGRGDFKIFHRTPGIPLLQQSLAEFVSRVAVTGSDLDDLLQ